MREHTHLPAMVGFVRNHVAQHFQANRPRRSPAVAAKLLDAAPTTAERFSEHLRAASGALGQSRTGLLRRAVRAVELSWNLQVRSCKPDPLGADIVHVREDRRNGADVAGRFGWRFGFPGGRVNMFDKNLVHAIIGGKDLDCSSAELSVNLVLTRGHGSLLLDLYYFRAVGHPEVIHFIRHAEPPGDQKPHLFCRIGRAFSPWAVALSAPRAFHPKEPERLLGGPGLPWADIGARRCA